MSYLYYQNVFGIRDSSNEDVFSHEDYLNGLFQEAQDWYDGATGYSRGDSRRDECMDKYWEKTKEARNELKKAIENGWVSEDYVPTIY